MRKVEAGVGESLYEFDGAGQMVAARPAGGTTQTYEYWPASDLRYSVDDGESKRYFLYDGGNVVEELDEGLATLASYIEGAGLDSHFARVSADGQVYAYVADPLGSVRAVVGPDGGVAQRYAYTAFGELRGASAPAPGFAGQNEYQFTGRRFDKATGLHYFRARFYDAAIGRFMAVDRQAPGQQTYGYTHHTHTSAGPELAYPRPKTAQWQRRRSAHGNSAFQWPYQSDDP